jgi:hypothetical protein
VEFAHAFPRTFLRSVYTNGDFDSVGCHSRIRHSTKNRILPIFWAVSDAAVAFDTVKITVRVNRPLASSEGASDFFA